MVNKQFTAISEEDLKLLDDAKDSKSTKRTVNRAVKLFRQYLGEENRFEQMPKYVLNSKIRTFFASIRTVKGEELKKSSLYSIKYGLSKYIKETLKIDINKDDEFCSAQTTFKAKLVDLQKNGKGSVEHKEQIADEDLAKLKGENMAFNRETPCGLQNKVSVTI